MENLHATRYTLCMMLFGIFLLAACERRPSETTLTVEHYRTHPQEREAKLRECANNPGELALTPNCVNAQQAGHIEGIGSQRELPPLDLPLPDKQREN